MTCVDVAPLSAVATIFGEQFANTGAETSINEKKINLYNKTTKLYKQVIIER